MFVKTSMADCELIQITVIQDLENLWGREGGVFFSSSILTFFLFTDISAVCAGSFVTDSMSTDGFQVQLLPIPSSSNFRIFHTVVAWMCTYVQSWILKHVVMLRRGNRQLFLQWLSKHLIF